MGTAIWSNRIWNDYKNNFLDAWRRKSDKVVVPEELKEIKVKATKSELGLVLQDFREVSVVLNAITGQPIGKPSIPAEPVTISAVKDLLGPTTAYDYYIYCVETGILYKPVEVVHDVAHLEALREPWQSMFMAFLRGDIAGCKPGWL